jgi:hypothetical protein
MRILLAFAGMLLCAGCTHTSAVSTCRADAQRFVDENASYDAEYDSQFGATTVGQLSTSNLLDRDTELIQCMETDPRNEKLYRAVLYRNGSIEGNRFFKYVLDTQQLPDFATWEGNEQATQLASYREKEN